MLLSKLNWSLQSYFRSMSISSNEAFPWSCYCLRYVRPLRRKICRSRVRQTTNSKITLHHITKRVFIVTCWAFLFTVFKCISDAQLNCMCSLYLIPVYYYIGYARLFGFLAQRKEVPFILSTCGWWGPSMNVMNKLHVHQSITNISSTYSKIVCPTAHRKFVQILLFNDVHLKHSWLL